MRVGGALPERLGPSNGRAYYVDGRRGNDRYPGTLARPWRTISTALARARLNGSRIYVRGGTYVEAIRFVGREAPAERPLTLRPYPGEHVTLTAPPRTQEHSLSVYRAGGLRILGFEITSPTSNGGIRIENSHDVEIASCDIHHTGHSGVLVVGTGTASPGARNIQAWGNRFHHNGGYWSFEDPYWLVGDHSIYWGSVSSHTDGIDHTAYGGVIANNLFYDQPVGRALQIGSQASGLIVTNNTFYRAYQADRRAGNAIEFYGEGSPFDTRNVLVVNNIIARNANYGVSGSGGNAVMQSNVVRNNLAWSNALGDFNTTYGSGGRVLFRLGENITRRPPRFSAPYRLDFRLQRSSPAIDRADPAYAPVVDRMGHARSGQPDIGAYEWAPPLRP